MRLPSRRWRLGLLTALLLVGAVVLGYALALRPSSKVTEANFQKLQVGMTPEQVDDILGPENQRGTRAGLAWPIYYQEQGGDVVITVVFGHPVEFGPKGLSDKYLNRVAQTLGDLLRGRLSRIRRRLGL